MVVWCGVVWAAVVVVVVIKRNMCYLLAESADYYKKSFWIVECVFPIYCSKVQCIAWDVNHRCRTSCNYSVHFRNMVLTKPVMMVHVAHLAGEDERCLLDELAAQPQHLWHLTAGQP